MLKPTSKEVGFVLHIVACKTLRKFLAVKTLSCKLAPFRVMGFAWVTAWLDDKGGKEHIQFRFD